MSCDTADSQESEGRIQESGGSNQKTEDRGQESDHASQCAIGVEAAESANGAGGRKGSGWQRNGPTFAQLRSRWNLVRRVIYHVAGEAADEPAVWERGVYRLWVWLLVERIVVQRDKMDQDELSAISRMVVDQRKVSVQQTKVDGQRQTPGEAELCGGRLPQQFQDVVDQIYGGLEGNPPSASL